MKRKNIEQLRRDALKMGAKKARIISASTIKTAPWVRYKCQFGCSGFADRLTCPPYSPSPGMTREIVGSYKKAILIHTPGDSKKDISDIVVKLEKAAFLAGYYKAFGMGAGPCRLCAECNVREACRHPERARPSMEACGIDVFGTVRANGFTIETLESGRCEEHYYGVVLIE